MKINNFIKVLLLLMNLFSNKLVYTLIQEQDKNSLKIKYSTIKNNGTSTNILSVFIKNYSLEQNKKEIFKNTTSSMLIGLTNYTDILKDKLLKNDNKQKKFDGELTKKNISIRSTNNTKYFRYIPERLDDNDTDYYDTEDGGKFSKTNDIVFSKFYTVSSKLDIVNQHGRTGPPARGPVRPCEKYKC